VFCVLPPLTPPYHFKSSACTGESLVLTVQLKLQEQGVRFAHAVGARTDSLLCCFAAPHVDHQKAIIPPFGQAAHECTEQQHPCGRSPAASPHTGVRQQQQQQQLAAPQPPDSRCGGAGAHHKQQRQRATTAAMRRHLRRRTSSARPPRWRLMRSSSRAASLGLVQARWVCVCVGSGGLTFLGEFFASPKPET